MRIDGRYFKGVKFMKVKEYLEWKHQKKLKKRRRKNEYSRKQGKNRDYDSQGD